MQIEGQGGKNSSAPKICRKDVGSLLIEQIRALAGPDHVVKMIRERSWASITFSGTRHSMTISRSIKENSGGKNTGLSPLFSAQIADHEFDLPGHFVADVLLDDREAESGSITTEILTIIDPVARREVKV